MKEADLSGITATVPPVNGNGTHRAKRNTAARKAAAGPAEDPQIAAAPFVEMGAEPVDSPMWLVQPAGWYQPDLAPEPPSWSGLAVERRGRIPVPDFLRPDAEPFPISAEPAAPPEHMTPGPEPLFPHSDLSPLGWDPRAHCPKEKGQ